MAKTSRQVALSTDPDLYFHTQAANLISDQERHTAGMRQEFADAMLKAIRAGAIHVYSHRDGTLRAFDASWTGPFCVRPADVNDWLERKTQYKFRWNANVQEGITSPTLGANPPQFFPPKPKPVAMAGVVQHTTKVKRRDILTPVIEHAQSLCKDHWDTAEIWGKLHDLVGEKYPVLLYLDGKAIAYTDGDETKQLTRKKLGDRLRKKRPN